MELKRYTLYLRAQISDRQLGGGGLTVEEQAEISADDFLEIAKILGQFHDLFERLRKERNQGA